MKKFVNEYSDKYILSMLRYKKRQHFYSAAMYNFYLNFIF